MSFKRSGHKIRETFFNKHHLLASISHPAFKLKWIPHDTEKRQELIDLLNDEVSLLKADICNSHDQSETVATSTNTNSIFYFEDEKTDHSLADEVSAFLKCSRRDLMSLKQFPTIEKIFRKYNTILASSASVERVFSFSSLIFAQKRHSISDSNFEKQLMLKCNQEFY